MSNSPQPKSPDSKQPTTETMSAAKNATLETNTQATPANTTASDSAAKTGTEATPDVKFTTDKIGQWKSQQENPFAEQNRRTATKKAQREATVRKVFPIGLIAGISLLSAALIFCVVMLIVSITTGGPITEFTAEESAVMQEEAQKIFDKYTQGIDVGGENLSEKDKENIQKAIQAVGSYYDRQATRIEDEQAHIQFVLDQIVFYLWNNQAEAALNVSKQINTGAMNIEDKISYYNLMGNIYWALDNIEQANYYFNLMREVSGDSYVEG